MTATTIAQAEAEAREFAAQYPTPNVAAAIGYAEAGRVSWFQVHELFRRALTGALTEVGT